MKKLISLMLALLLCVSVAVCVSAESEKELVVDEARLLSSKEEDELRDRLESISKKLNVDVVVVTVMELDGETPKDFAIDFYEEYEYGQGDDCDGVLLLVSMEERDYYILTHGLGEEAVNRDEAEEIGEKVADSLSEEEYAEAFRIFADEVEYEVDGQINGFPFDVGGTLITCLIIGLVVGLITASVLKGQLKSVRRQEQANTYVKSGSMKITQAGDYFMYRHVTRREKQQNNSSSSRSKSSYGGAGGKF